MMICTVSSGDESHSIGFGGAPVCGDFTGPGSERSCRRDRSVERGEEVTPARRGEKIPIITGECQTQTCQEGREDL